MRLLKIAEVNQTMTKCVTAIHRLSCTKVYMTLGRLDEAKGDLQMAIQPAHMMIPHFLSGGSLWTMLSEFNVVGTFNP